MPFTPFHMGVALVAKPRFNRNFSVITFGIAQVAMDIEPGVRMFIGSDVLHGPTHTLVGALLIAYLVMLISPSICTYVLNIWNREVTHHKLAWLAQPEVVPRTALISGAFLGTLSHVFLDCLIHHDIHPFLPFSKANPILGLVTHDGVYQLCAIAGVLGTVTWVAMQWVHRPAQFEVVNGPSNPVTASHHQGFWTLWVRELRFTWFFLFLLSIVPSLLFSSGLLPVALLSLAVCLVAPATAIGRIFGMGPKPRDMRQLVIMVLVPLLSLIYILKSDDQITTNAMPIVAAIESFRIENGKYPDTLEALTPKHLTILPELNYLLVQPRVSYRLIDKKPQLEISAAAGAFAHFEYDFAYKKWNYYD